jgi:hypothetical protein
MVLHWTHGTHVDFGKDIAFTYGPWGFVLLGYKADTMKFVVAGWTLMAAAFFAGILKLSRRLSAKRWLRGLFLVLTTALAGSAVDQAVDVRLFSSTCLLLLLYAIAGDLDFSAATLLLIAAAALASQIKFSMAIAAVAVLLAIAADQIRHKRLPWPLLVYLFAYLVLWVLAGQSLASLAAYVKTSVWITGGYAQGEGFSRPSETADTAWFILCALPLLATVLYAARRTARLHPRFWPAAGFPLLLLVIFKAGYVRHDEHEMEGTLSLALLGILIMAAAWPKLHPPAWKITAVAGAIAPMILSWHSFDTFNQRGLPGQMTQTFAQLPANLRTALQWMAGDSGKEQAYQTMLQSLRDQRPLPPVHGTVDIYSYGQRYVLATGLDYQPRPVFQSCLAYTPQLEQLNADSLTGPCAPDSILFDLQPIDLNYPSSEDGLAWPQILTHYDLTDADKSLLLLKRSAEPRGFSLIPLSRAQGQFGTAITVPDSADPVWVKIDVKPTPWGRIAGILDKPPMLTFRVNLQSGKAKLFRLVPGMAAAGFLLSPLVDSRQEFGLIEGTDWPDQFAGAGVTSFVIGTQTPDGKSACYRNEYDVTFSKLVFPHRDISAVPGVNEYVSFRDFIRHATVQPATAKMQLLPIRDGSTVLLTSTRTMLAVPAKPGAAQLHLRFGLLNSTDADVPAEAGRINSASFQLFIFTYDITGRLAGRVIWSRTLDPDHQPGDRGMQEANIDLGSPPPTLVSLETSPTSDGATAPAYWAGVQFGP